jgi:stage III sporulation protein AH
MVKRQTVWLSTMMVLSLMLIGYYTMNNGEGTGLNSGETTVSTGIDTPANNGQQTTQTSGNGDQKTDKTTSGKAQGNKGQAANSGKNGSSGGAPNATPTSGNAWYSNLQDQIEQTLGEKMDTELQIINSTSASSAQVETAQQKLTSLQSLDGGIKSAQEQIIGEGYSNCVIVPVSSPNSLLDKATVYVQTKSLSAADAVKVMNIVSQQLNLPIVQVQVVAHP